MKRVLELTQRLGGALMLPIAVLPVAGLLLRLGQPDLLDIGPMAAAGDAIFSNLGLLFAVGVAVGLAKENHGAAGLAGVIGFFVTTKGAEALLGIPAADAAKQLAKLSVPIGLVNGILAGWLYNRYSNTRLPPYLAFFGGKRFVPIVSGAAALALAFLVGWGLPSISRGMDHFSQAIVASGELGLFVYGVLNRVLIVTGLHHILNNVAWFIVGDYNGITGDLKRFFAGDPSAGVFMAGFFPVMMFGLPAACLAMYRTALPERRRAVGGLMLSMALTSFLTGVTEPIEFTFMFLAPWLYALHAVLTGLAMVTMDLLQVKLGFGFSAGFFDYALNYNKSTHPLYLVPVGLVYFALYYFLFHACIVRFNLRTPGREAEAVAVAATMEPSSDGTAGAFIRALGGRHNLRTVDACTTRLRLELAKPGAIDEGALRALGARGFVRMGEHGVQIVLGAVADQVATEIREALRAGGEDRPRDIEALLRALGGRDNIEKVEVAAGRVRVSVRDGGRVDSDSLRASGLRDASLVSDTQVHLLDGDPQALEAALTA